MKIFTILILACILGVTESKAQLIITVAGDSIQGFSGDGGPAISAELYYPWAVALDRYGNIYIADRSNQRIRKVDTNGIISTVAGNGTFGFSGDGGPATAAEINSPWGVAVDTTGNIYIADYSNNRIREVNTAGIINTIVGGGSGLGDGGPATAAHLYEPASVTLDKYGNLYIADLGDYRIRKVNTAGIISTIAGNGIQNYAGDGGPATAAELYWANSVTVDTVGNVFIADYGIYRIRKVSTSGIISTFAGNGTPGFKGDGGPATAAEVNALGGVYADISGVVYIADYGSQRIRKVNLSGIITTIAGDGKKGYSGDGGAAPFAELNEPQGMATDRLGNIYVADYGNSRIREIVLAVTGINKLFSNTYSIELFPNPNNGRFTIQLSVNSSQSVVEIYNMLGEKIYSEPPILNSPLSINISNQPAGIYLYRIITKDGNLVASGKFIIQ